MKSYAMVAVLVAACTANGPGPGSDGSLLFDVAATDAAGAPGTGAIEFHWTFAHGSRTCRDAAVWGLGVAGITVSIGGQMVDFPCSGTSGQSGTVRNVAAGAQQYAVGGALASQDSEALTPATGSVNVVAGAVTPVTVDLTPALYATNAVTFEWTFDNGQSCTAAGITDVRVDIDGVSLRFPCGANGQQGTVQGLSAGMLPFSIVGLANGTVLERADGQVLVTMNHTAPFPVDLSRVDAAHAGSVAFTWGFRAGAGRMGCANAQSDAIEIAVNNGAPMRFPCYRFDQPGVQGVTIDHLPAGPTAFTAVGRLGGGRSWQHSGSVNVVIGSATPQDLVLTPIDSTLRSALSFRWSFAGRSCTDAGVTQVRIGVTAVPNVDRQVPCSAGIFDGVQSLIALSGGSYDWMISATGTGGARYAMSGTLSTSSGEPDRIIHTDLASASGVDAGAAGGLSLDFRFGRLDATCHDLGIESVHLFVTDSNDTLVSGSEMTVACTSLPAVLSAIPAGANYFVNAEGLATAGSRFRSEVVHVTVAPGVNSKYTLRLTQVE